MLALCAGRGRGRGAQHGRGMSKPDARENTPAARVLPARRAAYAGAGWCRRHAGRCARETDPKIWHVCEDLLLGSLRFLARLFCFPLVVVVHEPEERTGHVISVGQRPAESKKQTAGGVTCVLVSGGAVGRLGGGRAVIRHLAPQCGPLGGGELCRHTCGPRGITQAAREKGEVGGV